MKDVLRKLSRSGRPKGRTSPDAGGPSAGNAGDEGVERRVTALFSLLGDLYGTDRLVLKAGRLGALPGMRSSVLGERVLALQRLVEEDPTIEDEPSPDRYAEILCGVEDRIADLIARKTVEEQIEKRIAARMQKRQQEYFDEIKLQVVREDSGPENPRTLKKFALLEKLDATGLARSAMEALRPTSLGEVVGQERAIAALLAKLGSPYPQHVILYGPPGVGKTTAARLALAEARELEHTPFTPDSPFVEVDGSTLRWDPREITNPLLGSVHDPIYQGARRDLAEGGVPEPKPGLVTEAHGGVLFIDEIGDLDPMLQNKLLKVLEDKRVMFDSAYYDPTDPNVPKYVKKLFDDGAPADFVLIGATTRSPDEISPAIRSRCAEVFFDPLTPAHLVEVIEGAARRLGVEVEQGVTGLLSEYTVEARKAVALLADAYGLMLYRRSQDPKRPGIITLEDVREVVRAGRLAPKALTKASRTREIGRVLGLAVSGYMGSVIEVEATVFPAKREGRGILRFNEAAGVMTKDSVFNAAAVLRSVTGKDLRDYDLYVNLVGGGLVDGPSAGLAVVLAMISAVEGRPVWQDIAVTGEVSIQGKVKQVGGLNEKLYGARLAGARRVLLPRANARDLCLEEVDVDLVAVDTVEEAMSHAFASDDDGG